MNCKNEDVPLRSTEWTTERFLEFAAKKPEAERLLFLAKAAAGWYAVASTGWSNGEWWRNAYWSVAAIWGGWGWRARLARYLTAKITGAHMPPGFAAPRSDAKMITVVLPDTFPTGLLP